MFEPHSEVTQDVQSRSEAGARTVPTIDITPPPTTPPLVPVTPSVLSPASAVAEHPSGLAGSNEFSPVPVSFGDLVDGPFGALPARVGNYEVLEEIARGGMGVVYKALQVSLGRKVALKVIPGPAHGNQRAVERFEREAQAAAALDHPDIVPVYEIGELNSFRFFAMALVEGPSLAALVKRSGVLPLERSVAIMISICDAMCHAHGKGILHRDLKPENVLLDADNRPRLTDFGLAKWIFDDRGLTQHGQIIGTPSYMAPEQAQGDSTRVAHTADIYSLGGILFFLLTGQPPFKGDSVLATLVRVVQDPPPKPRSLNPQVPAELERICLRCLDKDPGRRYASVQELTAELKEYSLLTWPPLPSSVRSREYGVLPPTPVRKRPSWEFAVMAGTAALAGVLMVLIAWAIYSRIGSEAGTGLAQGTTVTEPTRPGPSTLKEGTNSVIPTGTGQRITPPPPPPPPPPIPILQPFEKEKLKSQFPLKVVMEGVREVGGKKVLSEGDEMRFAVTPEQDAFVGLWSINSDGTIVQLYPNKHEPAQRVNAGETQRIPGNNKYYIRAEPSIQPEWIFVAACSEPLPTLKGESSGDFLYLKKRIDQISPEDLRGPLIITRGDLSELTLIYEVKPKPPVEKGSSLYFPLSAWVTSAAVAQATIRDAEGRKVFAEAEENYTAGKLLDAEPLYLKVLDKTEGQTRQTCYDRLLDIYVRLGRQDKVVQTASLYRDWLKNQGKTGPIGVLALLQGQAYLSLGYYLQAVQYLDEALRWRPALASAQEMAGHADRARAAERLGQADLASKHWARAKVLALGLLRAPEGAISAEDRLASVRHLSDAYRYEKKPREGAIVIEGSLRQFNTRKDRPARRDVLIRLASHQGRDRNHEAAEKALTEALELHGKLNDPDQMVYGDIYAALGEALAHQGKSAKAAEARKKAADYFTAIWKSAGKGTEARGGEAFWRLQRVYQGANNYEQALVLAGEQAEVWHNRPLVLPRVEAEQGSLSLTRSEFDAARKLLASAVKAMEEQKPSNLINLAHVMASLASVEQAAGRTVEADQQAKKCLELYAVHKLPGDTALVQAHNELGTLATLGGNQALAIEHFRKGRDLCKELGEEADPQLCTIMLNIALVHWGQGELTSARDLCLSAYELYRGFAEPDSRGELGFVAALATLELSDGKFKEALAHAGKLAELCAKLDIKTGPFVVTHKHCRAMYHLNQREDVQAEKLWREILKMQEEATEGTPLFIPRTLNYLGIAVKLQGRIDDAEKLFQKACDLQKDNPWAVTATHYISLWQLARIKKNRDKHDEYRALLRQAVDVVEPDRLRVFGAGRARVAYFERFEGAMEELIDSYVEHKLIDQACVYAARGRSRALFDEFQMAGFDPRQDAGEKLKKDEAELNLKVTELRARAQAMTVKEAATKEGEELVKELLKAQKAYEDVWREVLNASPRYRNMASPQQLEQTLATVRRKALKDNTWLLQYWIGRDRSYAFLVGPENKKAEVYPLHMAADAVAQVKAEAKRLADLALEKQKRQGGDLVATRVRGAKIIAIPTVPKNVKSVGVGRGITEIMVGAYRDTLEDRNFDGTRGLRLEAVPKTEPEMPVEVMAAAFLPVELRQRLKELNLDQLLVVPDGALHKLPLEALVLKPGDVEKKVKPVYGLDELPPLIYAPSTAVLASMLERPAAAKVDKPSLLTVGGVAYERTKAPSTPEVRPSGRVAKTLIDARADLIDLKFSKEESEKIQERFDPTRVKALAKELATEKEVVTAMKGKQVIHLAAHGFAYENDADGSLFAALALARPASGVVPSPDNDGNLTLLEIYRLPLQDCELAVLSACVTNVGPQAATEASITLANGFLIAGARRVVASHWNVNDTSTALLMENFFNELYDKDGKPTSYTKALQRAQRKLRNSNDWSSPCHWAPFVLLGSN